MEPDVLVVFAAALGYFLGWSARSYIAGLTEIHRVSYAIERAVDEVRGGLGLPVYGLWSLKL